MPLSQTTYKTSQLPEPTRLYLFDLMINGHAATMPKETLQENPDGIAGKTVKFGSERGRAPGNTTYNRGRAGLMPEGQFRIVKHVYANSKVKWFYAKHSGGNTYIYYEIILPLCEPCYGTGEIPCDRCNGSQTINPYHRITPEKNIEKLANLGKCLKCKGTSFMPCTTCRPPGTTTPRSDFYGKPLSLQYSTWG